MSLLNMSSFFQILYDGVVGDRRLDLLVDKMEKFLMEPIDISKKDFQSMKNFFESYGLSVTTRIEYLSQTAQMK